MIVRELVTKLGFSLDSAKFKQAEASTNRLKEQANNAAFAVRNMFAGFAGVQGVRSLIAVGDQVQSLQARIAILPQTIYPAGVAFDKVAEKAIESRSSLDAYGTLFTRVGHASKDFIKTSDGVADVTSTISKALVVGGATAAEASSTMIQFAQALGSGTLQGEEFRAMAEAAPQFMDKLAESLGHPRGALKKLASEGKITSKDVIEATLKMKDHFDKEMMKIPMTVGQATTVIGVRWAKMINKMNNETMFITKIANTMLDGFDKIVDGSGKVVDAFSGISNMLRQIGVLIGVIVAGKFLKFAASVRFIRLAVIALSGGNVLRALSILRIALVGAFLPLLKIGLMIAAVSYVVDDFIVYLNGGNSVIGDFVGWLNSGSIAADSLKAVLIALGMFIGGFLIVYFAQAVFQLGLIAAGYVASGAAALIAGAKIAAGWLMTLGPIGLVIAGLSAIVWLISKIAGSETSFNVPGTDEFGAAGYGADFGVSQSSMSPSAMGQGAGVQNNNTNVQVTVPPGTTAEQAAFLKSAAQKSFGAMSEQSFARGLGVYSK
ncbi:MAG: tape measure protein [Shewanella oncorhynchi]